MAPTTCCSTCGSSARPVSRVCSRPCARPDTTPDPPGWRFDPPTLATREAVWELAGPLRSAHRLERLLSDPYPLARLIARFALLREESRGSHRRLEFPDLDPALDGQHLVCSGDELLW